MMKTEHHTLSNSLFLFSVIFRFFILAPIFFLYFSYIAMTPKEDMAIDKARCGISSAQMFAGEDLRKGETDKEKQEEMRRWVKERLSHQDYQKMCDKVENMNYAALLQTVDAIRGATLFTVTFTVAFVICIIPTIRILLSLYFTCIITCIIIVICNIHSSSCETGIDSSHSVCFFITYVTYVSSSLM